jgi:hypothetical protein
MRGGCEVALEQSEQFVLGAALEYLGDEGAARSIRNDYMIDSRSMEANRKSNFPSETPKTTLTN